MTGFTDAAQGLITSAHDLAAARGAEHITAAHLLLAATAYPEVGSALRSAGLTPETLAMALDPSRAGFARADADALEAIGIDLAGLGRAVDDRLGEGAFERPGRPRPRTQAWGPLRAWKHRESFSVPFGDTAKRALLAAADQGRRLGVRALGPALVALAALDGADPAVGRALAGTDLGPLRAALARAAQDAA